MEIRDLDYFLHVASCGHVGHAAEKLGLTQPALTKSIARLEREMHAQLFERTPHGVILTRLGERLVVHAKRLRYAAAITKSYDLSFACRRRRKSTPDMSGTSLSAATLAPD